MRDFTCPNCGQRLAFENSVCLSCGSALGFSLNEMALLVIAIVRSLRASWLAAVLTGVLASLGLWELFEQVLLVQLPDGLIRGF